MKGVKFRAWDIERGLYEDIHDLYWFEENGVRGQSEDGTFQGHHGRYIIEQFTGLHDSEGKEIYEGDIISWIAFGIQNIQIVKTIDYEHDDAYSWSGFRWDVDPGDCLIIGNIRQNPELLH